MDRKKKLLPLLGYFGLLILIVVAAFLTGKQGGGETIKEVMKDAVLHEDNRIAFLGGMTVNPGLISAYTVTGILLLFAAVWLMQRFNWMVTPELIRDSILLKFFAENNPIGLIAAL